MGDRGPLSSSLGQRPLGLHALPHVLPAMGEEKPGHSVAGDSFPGHFPHLTHKRPQTELAPLQPAQLKPRSGSGGACPRPGSQPEAGRTTGSQPWGSLHPPALQWGGTSRDHRSVTPVLALPKLPRPLLGTNWGAAASRAGAAGTAGQAGSALPWQLQTVQCSAGRLEEVGSAVTGVLEGDRAVLPLGPQLCPVLPSKHPKTLLPPSCSSSPAAAPCRSPAPQFGSSAEHSPLELPSPRSKQAQKGQPSTFG